MRIVDWSPDGTELVVAVHRIFQQNLYIIDAEGGELKPIMMDDGKSKIHIGLKMARFILPLIQVELITYILMIQRPVNLFKLQMYYRCCFSYHKRRGPNL